MLAVSSEQRVSPLGANADAAGGGTANNSPASRRSDLADVSSSTRRFKEKGHQRDLDRWKEDPEADDVGLDNPAGNNKGKSNGLGSDWLVESSKKERAKRAVTSESWDDDFLFQHGPAPPTSPSRSHSRAPSRSHASRPTTPLPSQKHAPPPSSVSLAPNRINPPSSSTFRGDSLARLVNPSLDSVVSSLDWSPASDQEEPTLTMASEHSTPKAPLRVLSSSESPRGHRSTASTSTARPSPPPIVLSAAGSQISRRPPPRPLSYHLPSRIPSNATTVRSETPSLTADSLRSLTSTTTTCDELRTETEDDETEDERRTVATSPRTGMFGFKRYSQESVPLPPTSPSLKSGNSKRWKFGRSKKEPSERKERSSGIFGRRTGPREPEEVVTIDRDDLDAYDHHLRRSGLPLPVRDGQFVVLGRRTRTTVPAPAETPFRLGAAPRAKHASSSSTATNASTDSQLRPHYRSSLQFAPSSTQSQPPSLPHSPRESSRVATSTNRIVLASNIEGDDTTTEADVSEFSGDERFHLPTRLSNHRRRSIATTTPSTSYSSKSPASPFNISRPSSPVESILGDRIGKWNTSQVSFASSASALGLEQTQIPGSPVVPPTGYETTRPEDSVKNRKRKLVKRRPGSEILEQSSLASLGIEGATGLRPLLSAVSSRSSASSHPTSTASTLQVSVPRTNHARSPSLPFAQDSDVEFSQRPKYTRRRSSTTPSKPSERGEVIELDPDWLGVVPFPPSPQTSRVTAGVELPPLPPSPSPNSRPSTSRSLSGKSHPPVTSRTQAEAKAKRNSGGLSQSISNMLSRSTPALPLGGGGGGKRAPSPAPSAKSGKSNRSLLSRTGSAKGKERAIRAENDVPTLPKSPSLSLLKKRSSSIIVPPRSTPTKLPVSSPSTPNATIKLTRRSRTSIDASRPKSPSVSSPSFFSRARGLSRSTGGEPPPSPRTASIARSSSSSKMPPPPVPPRASNSTSRQSSTPKGQLNTSFRMPRSAISPSSRSTDSTSLPSDPLAGTPPIPSSKIEKTSPSQQTRSAQAGHRPSLSLSSLMRSPSPSAKSRVPPSGDVSSSPCSPSPYERPRTALGTDHPRISQHHHDDDDLVSGLDLVVPRRNSLSDLRIPARITNAQKKIEEDLERVKQFAKGVEELKALRLQHDQLLQLLIDPADLGSLGRRASLDVAGVLSHDQTAPSLRRVELDYSKWWEQARTLIDLGDGKPQQASRTSPGTLSSRRDRCVSMAAESIASTRVRVASGSETETEQTDLFSTGRTSVRPIETLRSVPSGGSSSRRGLSRMPSASSIETEASVGARQREMLRGVLAPPNKGASLPSRGVPEPRPGLAILTELEAKDELRPRSPSLASPAERPPASLRKALPPSLDQAQPSNSRRVSRVGVSGIREFLLRLRHRATEELANSVGTLPPPSATVPSCISVPPRRSFSDPTSRPVTPSHSRRPTPSSLLQHVAASAADSSPLRRRSGSSKSSSEEGEEDWDADLASLQDSPVESILRRSRTVSVGTPKPGGSGGSGGKEMMILTTENMPQLLEKVKEVEQNCKACIDVLKTLTLQQ